MVNYCSAAFQLLHGDCIFINFSNSTTLMMLYSWIPELSPYFIERPWQHWLF